MIDKAFDRIARVIELVLAFAFILAVLLNFANVVGRYLFGISLLGSDEVQVFIMVGMTFLGAVVVTRRNQHLRMDVLVQFMPRRCALALRIAEQLLLAVLAGFVVCAILFLRPRRCFGSAAPATWPACRCGSRTAPWRSDLR